MNAVLNAPSSRWSHASCRLAMLLASLALPGFAASINVGSYQIGQDTASFQIPVRIIGTTNEFATDMAGIVQIGDPATNAPLITAINYSNTVWSNAPGGSYAFATYSLSNSTYDPNVSLAVANQKVALTNGLLFSLTVNVAGLPPGDYPLRLSGVVLSGVTNDTRLKNGEADVSVSITNGNLTVVPRLRIQSLGTNLVAVRFKTFVGRTNVLQWRTNVASDQWQDISPAFAGTGSEVVWPDALSPTNRAPKFYRLQVR